MVNYLAKEEGNALAIVRGQERLARRDFRVLYSSLALQLRALRIGSGDVVAVTLGDRLNSVAAMVAINAVGACYLPISLEEGHTRATEMIQSCGASSIVDSETLTIRLSTPPVSNHKFSTPEGTAYIMYTSGSTGKAKGIYILERSILNLVSADLPKFVATDSVLQTSSLAFDASTFEVWSALLKGLPLVLSVQGSIVTELEGLLMSGCTVAWLTAPLFHALADADSSLFRGLRVLISGGDRLSPRHVGEALMANKGLTIINGYGPTETTTFATTYRVPRVGPGSITSLMEQRREIPIGAAVRGVHTHIVGPEPDLGPGSIGEVEEGELVICGLGVSPGYVGEHQHNFIGDPCGLPGQSYRSGDLVRRGRQGLEFLGRIDRQIKVRGHRVEPAEIERAMLEEPTVKSAYVATLDRSDGERSLVAVFDGDGELSEMGMRRWLATHLPQHLIPHIIRRKERPWALNSNGKLDLNEIISTH